MHNFTNEQMNMNKTNTLHQSDTKSIRFCNLDHAYYLSYAGFLFGYDIGATSYVVSYLATSTIISNDSSSLSLMDAPFKTGWIVSSPSFGALLGTIILMYIDNNDNDNNDNGLSLIHI